MMAGLNVKKTVKMNGIARMFVRNLSLEILILTEKSGFYIKVIGVPLLFQIFTFLSFETQK